MKFSFGPLRTLASRAALEHGVLFDDKCKFAFIALDQISLGEDGNLDWYGLS